METMEITKIEKDQILTGQELIDKINKTINLIRSIIDENDYQVNVGLYKLTDPKILNELSKRQIKKINRALYYVSQKKSRRSINRLFYLLNKNLDTPKIHVKVSKKEEEIQKYRKEWLELRNKADEALLKYKECKGDYYKNKLSK